MSSREYRVSLALKWHYLDNLSAPEIRDRMDRQGVADLAVSTIRDYLNEKPAEEVERMIEEEHANTRLQILEHEQQLFERAREAELSATEDRKRVGMVPRTTVNEGDRAIGVADWRELAPDDPEAPDWATDEDTIIAFTDGQRTIEPGERYPIQSVTGEPMYQQAVVGLERDQPDLETRQSLRYEQSKHLENKGKVAGVYDREIDLDMGEIAVTSEVVEVTEADVQDDDGDRDQEADQEDHDE